MSEYYIGVMSGTSFDGVDVALVDIKKQALINSHYQPYPQNYKNELNALALGCDNEIHRLGLLDKELGEFFANAVNALIDKISIPKKEIKAIGSHGQTIRHFIKNKHNYGYSLQIGCPAILAYLTGLIVVSDFRRADLARFGVGAPLAPFYHQALFLKKHTNAMVVNIGGIANISLYNHHQLIGFDIGPGNVLLDAWCAKYLGKPYDKKGQWASSGKLDKELLKALLKDNFFKQLPPKSIGKEYFSLAWLDSYLRKNNYQANDIQRTLIELTAHSIIQAAQNYNISELLVCGGGAKNSFLIKQLKKTIPVVKLTDEVGIDSDFLEAMMFAWLAYCTLNKQRLALSSVTGANAPAILGSITYP